jgi:hypothetical protein
MTRLAGVLGLSEKCVLISLKELLFLKKLQKGQFPLHLTSRGVVEGSRGAVEGQLRAVEGELRGS